jgi:hypothetical protein
MKKTFNFLYGSGRKLNRVKIEVELRGEEKPVFSASGEIWESGKCICAGQCLNDVCKLIKSETFKKIYHFWKLYHLNDMHAGTPEQEQAIEEALNNGILESCDYSKACDYLKSVNLYEVMHEGKLYKYGHSWLYEEIPAEDLKAIKDLLTD